MEEKRKTGVCLGLDLGGTKLLIGEVDMRGKVLRSRRYPSAIAEGAGQTQVLENVMEQVDAYLQEYSLVPGKDFDGIGMGMVGRVDPAKGMWLEIQKPRMETVEAAGILARRYGVPCGIDNDVRSAAAAEQRFGRAKGCRNFIYMNIGTGIGAAFVIDGRMLTGAHFCAGEVGHHVTDSQSEVECPCGRMGCVEALASGMGLHERAVSMRGQYPDTALSFPARGRIDGRDIFILAEQGDPLCVRLAGEAAKAVAETLDNLLWLADPERIILGGGLITDGRLLGRVRGLMSPMATRFLADGVERTTLDSDYAGLIGAAAVAMRQLET